MVVVIALLVLTARGGFGLRPTGIIEASKYSKGENTAFVLPTAFTMIKTMDQSSLIQVEYYAEKEVDNYFNPVKTSNPQNLLPDNTNVMVIMLESFGKECVYKAIYFVGSKFITIRYNYLLILKPFVNRF